MDLADLVCPFCLGDLFVRRGRDLTCQPCTLHGRPACPKGHHRCMTDLGPDAVLAALHPRLARVHPVR